MPRNVRIIRSIALTVLRGDVGIQVHYATWMMLTSGWIAMHTACVIFGAVIVNLAKNFLAPVVFWDKAMH